MTSSSGGLKRPIGVTLVAILQILIGLFFLLAAFGTLAFGPVIVDDAIALIVTAVLFVIAILCFVVALALLGGKSWVWYIAVIVTSFELISTAIGLLLSLGGNLMSMLDRIVVLVIVVLMLAYLFSWKVKAWFRVL